MLELARSRGEREESQSERQADTHVHTHARQRRKKSSSYKEIERIASSECTAGTGRQVKWKNQQGGKIGDSSRLPPAFVLTTYYTLHWAQCHLVCVHDCEALETWGVCRH